MHSIGVHCAILKDRRSPQSAGLQGLFFLEYTESKSLAAQLSRWIENQVKEAKKIQSEATSSLDLSFDERESLKRELIAHRRNLNKLSEQAAVYASGQTPLHLLNQIEAEQVMIEDLQEKLANLT